MKPIIGIAGKARSGKDAVTNFIISDRGGYRYSLAGPIKAMVAVGLGIDMTDLYWKERKELSVPALGKSPREIMQTLGTEWGREMINENIWLILAASKLLQMGPGMVISDVRFQNEAEWIRDRGGLVIHVVRPNALKVAEHSSENGVVLKPEDLIIHNTGTLEELQIKVKELLIKHG